MEEKNINHHNRFLSKTSDLCLRLFGGLYRHPFLLTAWLCLGCLLIHSAEPSGFNILLPALGIALLGGAAALVLGEKANTREEKRFGVIVAVAALAAAVLFCYFVFMKHSFHLTVMDGGLSVVGGIFFVLAARGKLSTRNVILLLFAAGFLMRLSYILYMGTGSIQHDVGAWGLQYEDGSLNSGHAGYIEYLYQNGHLPDFDVRMVDQFYHPPLHHLFAAVWMRLLSLTGVSVESAFENIQILTLFYSSVCLILSYKIFRRIGLKDSGLILATAVVAFCPTFYIMAGSINNDILSIAFMLGGFYNALCWYKTRKLGRILCIALCVGLGMMTKLSVWMAAPPIAFIFIYVFFSDLRQFKRYLGQFAAFLGVCVPLGLFWAVRNLMMWGMPLTYVQRLPVSSAQYVGNIPVLQRLFDFSPYQFADVAEQFSMYNGGYNEFNPLVGFFKTSVFDEGIAVRRFPMIAGFNQVLFWSAVIVGLAGFAAMIYFLIKKNQKTPFPVRLAVGVFYVLVLGLYYLFCFSFPHVCTQNVRYGVPLIVLGALALGYLGYDLLHSKRRGARIGGRVLSTAVGVYAFSGFLVYQTVALSFVGL